MWDLAFFVLLMHAISGWELGKAGRWLKGVCFMLRRLEVMIDEVGAFT